LPESEKSAFGTASAAAKAWPQLIESINEKAHGSRRSNAWRPDFRSLRFMIVPVSFATRIGAITVGIRQHPHITRFSDLCNTA
jgi:hypothetical protein